MSLQYIISSKSGERFRRNIQMVRWIENISSLLCIHFRTEPEFKPRNNSAFQSPESNSLLITYLYFCSHGLEAGILVFNKIAGNINIQVTYFITLSWSWYKGRMSAATHQHIYTSTHPLLSCRFTAFSWGLWVVAAESKNLHIQTDPRYKILSKRILFFIL